MGSVKSKVTSKRQVTLPLDVCVDLGIHPGDEIEWVRNGKAVHVRKVVDRDRFKKWQPYFADLKGKDIDALVDEWRGR